MGVESAPGEGTTFTITLPLWTGTAERGAEETDVHPARRGKILVVEDEEDIREMLSELLSRDHEVEAVPGGREALERFAPEQFDVALIDLGMPEMPGDQVARKMRQVDPLIAIVLITGWPLRESDSRVAAFDFWVKKPFGSLRDVEDAVSRALELKDRRVSESV